MQRYFGMSLSAVILCAAMWSCGGKAAGTADDKNIVVSIAPLKYVVERIAGDDFAVEVLVPEGASPETYSPTPKQMMQIEDAEFVFITDLIDFERELIRKLPESVRLHAVADVSEGIDLLYGTHSHDDHDEAEAADHKHGADPHIWTSPQRLKQIASTVYNKILAAYPDSVKYTKNYAKFISELEHAEEYIRERLAGSGKSYFIIYHPALSYYANDFGLEQVSIEDDGKEPSAAHMKEIACRASTDGIKYIFYQRQFPRTAVETIARDAGAFYSEVNPLTENIVDELVRITDLIAE